MQTRVAFLKSSTGPEHDAVEARLMALQPFASRERYGLFLRAQLGFHRHVEPFYRVPMMTDDTHASRLALIEADVHDLGAIVGPGSRLQESIVIPGVSSSMDATAAVAAGWLYVAEGSKLGAAVLFKAAGALGLDAGFGARHLAVQGEGRAQAWRRFTAALDGLALTAEEDEAAAAAARAAFRFFAAGMEQAFAGAAAA